MSGARLLYMFGRVLALGEPSSSGNPVIALERPSRGLSVLGAAVSWIDVLSYRTPAFGFFPSSEVVFADAGVADTRRRARRCLGRGGRVYFGLPPVAAVTASAEGIPCSLISLGLVLAGSVTGMLSAALAAILLIVRNKKRRSLGTFRLAAASLLGWAGVNHLHGLIPSVNLPWTRFSEATGTLGSVGTLQLRLLTDQYAISRIIDSPIRGVGLDPQSGGTYDGSTLTHNLILLVWMQGGFALLVAVLLVIAASRSAVSNGFHASFSKRKRFESHSSGLSRSR